MEDVTEGIEQDMNDEHEEVLLNEDRALQKQGKRPGLSCVKAMIRCRMQLEPDHKALDWTDDENPKGWKELSASEVWRLKSAAHFNELDELVQNRTTLLRKLLQEHKVYSYILGIEMNENLEGSHFHLYFKSRLKINDLREIFDQFSQQFEEDKVNFLSPNSVGAISASNFRHQAGYAAKEHFKPFPCILEGNAFVTYDTTLSIRNRTAFMSQYYGSHDPHYFPAKLLKSRHVRELPLRWRAGYQVWVEANQRRSAPAQTSAKKSTRSRRRAREGERV